MSTEVICCLCGIFAENEVELRKHTAESHQTENWFTQDKNFIAQQMSPEPELPQASDPGQLIDGYAKLVAAAAFMMPFDGFIKYLANKSSREHLLESFKTFVNDNSASVSETGSDSGLGLGGESTCVSDMSSNESVSPPKNNIMTLLPPRKVTNTKDTDAPKPHKCSYCGKGFSLKQNMQVHERIHTGEKPYQCPFCPARFSDARNCKSHRATHTKERPFSCNLCGNRFTRNSSLIQHQVRHVDSFPFECKCCDMRFKRYDVFRKHMFGHSHAFRYQCRFCPTRFSTRKTLEAHQLSDHQSSCC